MLLQITLLILGLVGLWFFSEIVVNRSIKIARALNVTDSFIGLTVLSIGTSVPEIATVIIASLDKLKGVDASAIAISTVIGSDIIQLTLILGIIGLITTVFAYKKILYNDYIMMIAAHLIVFIISLAGIINKFEGFLLIAIYVIYLFELTRKEKVFNRNREKTNYWIDSSLIIAGIALLLLSGKFVVDSSIFLSQTFNTSQTFFGALIIGLSTSLPELTTALQGLRKKARGISLGVLIGSNITNPLLGVGIGAMISGFTITRELIIVDMPFFLITAVVVFFFFKSDMRISKKESFALLGIYLVYAILKLRLLF